MRGQDPPGLHFWRYMNHRELIAAASNLDAASLLERRGARLTNNRTRFSPCPACGEGGDKGRGVCVITKTRRGFQCYANGSGSGCGAKGSSLDILLYLEGLDPKAPFTDTTYEAIARELGEHTGSSVQQRPPEPPAPPLFTQPQIAGYYRSMCEGRGDAPVKRWLCETRGLPWDGSYTCGVAILERQIPSSRPDLRAALAHSPAAVFPLYSTHPDRLGQFANLVIRPIMPTVIDPGDKRPWKAKCLNRGPGTTRDDSHPLVYGNPILRPHHRRVIVVEGALDQATLDAIAGHNSLTIGAFCAGDIPLLAGYLNPIELPVILIPHLDRATKAHPGGAGQETMAALHTLFPRSTLFDWPVFLNHFGITLEQFAAAGATDVNDLVRTDNGPRIATFNELRRAWLETNV